MLRHAIPTMKILLERRQRLTLRRLPRIKLRRLRLLSKRLNTDMHIHAHLGKLIRRADRSHTLFFLGTATNLFQPIVPLRATSFRFRPHSSAKNPRKTTSCHIKIASEASKCGNPSHQNDVHVFRFRLDSVRTMIYGSCNGGLDQRNALGAIFLVFLEWTLY